VVQIGFAEAQLLGFFLLAIVSSFLLSKMHIHEPIIELARGLKDDLNLTQGLRGIRVCAYSSTSVNFHLLGTVSVLPKIQSSALTTTSKSTLTWVVLW